MTQTALPALLHGHQCSGYPAGKYYPYCGGEPDRRSEGRAYSIDEMATVGFSDAVVARLPLRRSASVGDTGYYAVTGKVEGACSGVVGKSVGDEVWMGGSGGGVQARCIPAMVKSTCGGKPGRFGSIELGVGRGSVFPGPAQRNPGNLPGRSFAATGARYQERSYRTVPLIGGDPAGSEIR